MHSLPLPHQIVQSAALRRIAQKLWTRDLLAMDSVFVAPLVFLIILSAMAFTGLFYITWKAWTCAREDQNIDIEAALTISPERRLSYWMSQNVAMRQNPALRQNSATRQSGSLVWTTNLEDKDILDFQFSLPSQSRFSMDSEVSVDTSICPLDRSYITKSELEKYCTTITEIEIGSDTCDSSCSSRCQSPVGIVRLTAMDKGRAVSQPFLHQYEDFPKEFPSGRRSTLPHHYVRMQT
ncbi:hypothetical protein LTR84_001685 [Exophiala bonariae]|uniref:Uncharacterized protein n=1 Tax=Exophiala bonariae TaxID=1690606 RepID=A0AAV9NDF2_9EURO|nr:hypothetical protein LTR84_001685 [Exophiala bonariae]